MHHQTQESHDRNRRSLHQMPHPASHTTGRGQEGTQAFVATEDGNTRLWKSAAWRDPPRLIESFLEGQVIYPQATAHDTSYWECSREPSGNGILASLSFTRSWRICNVIEYSLWPSQLHTWQPPNHPLSCREAKFAPSPKRYLFGLMINLGCLFLGNRRLRNFDHPHNCLKEFRQRDFPGGLVVNTPGFHCRGYGFHPWSEKLRPHMLCGAKNKNKKKTNLDRGHVPGIELSSEGSVKSMGWVGEIPAAEPGEQSPIRVPSFLNGPANNGLPGICFSNSMWIVFLPFKIPNPYP